MAGADQDQGGGAVFGGKLEATQGAHVGIGQPQQDDCTAAGGQGLPGSPAGVGRALGMDQEQALQGDSGPGQSEWVESDGRCDAYGPAPGGDFCQKGQQQAQFADTGLGHQDFTEGAHRPAASRQLGIQGGKAAGDAGDEGRCQLVAPPDQLLQG